MNETKTRLTEPGLPPTPDQLEAWMGGKAFGFCTRIVEWIERSYPGAFRPEWLLAGRKHGWSLRYKKGKSFCSLVRNRTSL